MEFLPISLTLYSPKAIIVPHHPTWKYEVSTLAVDGWAVTSGTAKRGLGGAAAHRVPFSLYQMGGQCTNYRIAV